MNKQQVEENKEMADAVEAIWRGMEIDRARIVTLRGTERLLYLRPFLQQATSQLKKQFTGVSQPRIDRHVSAGFRRVWMNPAVYQSRIDKAQQQQAHWREKIEAAPDGTTEHQLGVWRGKLRDWRQAERAARERLERLD